MSNLPPLTLYALERFQSDINSLVRGGSRLEPKPHKLIMLLSVLDMFDRQILRENSIYYSDELRRTFESFFRLTCGPDDWCQPGPPFFHLRTSDFWNHQVKPGREKDYGRLSTSGGGNKWIEENIAYAYLSDYAYLVMTNDDARRQLRTFISALLNPKV